MSRYAHVNLLDLDDSIAGRVDGLEGRFGRSKLESRDLGISHWRYAPNLQVPAGHRHREQEEAYIVVAGSGRILVDDEVIELRMWDVVRLAPDTVRAFAAGPDGMELIAVGGPKPEGGDGEQVPVSWPD
jgi:quercetin dioxygenase-like cupin family protein